MSDHQNGVELVKLYTDLTGKISFMLITASTASIAYVLTQIKDESWSSLIYLPLFSLTLLGLSFLCGCNSLNSKASMLHNNGFILQAIKNPERATDVEEAINELERNSKKISFYNKVQYIAFIFGAFSYALFVFFKILIK